MHESCYEYCIIVTRPLVSSSNFLTCTFSSYMSFTIWWRQLVAETCWLGRTSLVLFLSPQFSLPFLHIHELDTFYLILTTWLCMPLTWALFTSTTSDTTLPVSPDGKIMSFKLLIFWTSFNSMHVLIELELDGAPEALSCIRSYLLAVIIFGQTTQCLQKGPHSLNPFFSMFSLDLYLCIAHTLV